MSIFCSLYVPQRCTSILGRQHVHCTTCEISNKVYVIQVIQRYKHIMLYFHENACQFHIICILLPRKLGTSPCSGQRCGKLFITSTTRLQLGVQLLKFGYFGLVAGTAVRHKRQKCKNNLPIVPKLIFNTFCTSRQTFKNIKNCQ